MIRYLNIAIFALLAIGAKAQTNNVIDEVSAVIGSEILLKSDIEKQVIQYKSQGTAIDDEMRCKIIEDLMFSKLLLNQANLDSVEISNKQVEGELDRRIKYFVSQIGSERALEDYYKKSMAEIKKELRSNLRDQMIVQQMQGRITDGTDITPSEVSAFFNELPEDSLPLINAQVEVAQCIIIAPPNRLAVEEARNKLNELRERILGGEDFSTLAILYSEDPGTATQGGELGFVGRAEVDPAFAEASFKLKGSEVSRIVKSEFGLHIIQLIEKDGDKINVRHILIKPKVEGTDILMAKDKCDSIKLKVEAFKDTLTFAIIAMRHSDDVDSKNNGGLMVNGYTGSSLFELEQLDPAVYIAIENLEENEVSEPTTYSTRDGKRGYALYYVLKKVDAHRANLTLDYQKIQEAALNQKKEKAINKWIEKKLKTTYTKIEGDFKSCEFDNDWYKVN